MRLLCNHRIEPKRLKVCDAFPLMLNPARHFCLQDPQSLACRDHLGNRFHRCAFIDYHTWSNHAIDDQIVHLDPADSRVSVDTQYDRVDVGLAQIDIWAVALSKKPLSLFEFGNDLGDRRSRPSPRPLMRGTENHLGKRFMRSGVSRVGEYHSKTHSVATFSTSQPNRSVQFRNDAAGIDRIGEVNKGSISRLNLKRLDPRFRSRRSGKNRTRIVFPELESRPPLVERLDQLSPGRFSRREEGQNGDNQNGRRTDWE